MSFIIYALPRSRTRWLSEFLTYKDHFCGHELAMFFRNMEDVYKYFSDEKKGSAEPGIAQGFWLLHRKFPDLKTVVIRRPVQDVVTSLLNIDLSGIASYDKDKLIKHIEKWNRLLDRIEKLPNVLVVNFDDLNKMSSCQQIFEHCLPYKFDIKWWGSFKKKNIQINFREMIAYYHMNKQEIDNFKVLCKKELIKVRKEDPHNHIWQY